MDPHQASPTLSTDPSTVMPALSTDDQPWVITDCRNEPSFPHLLYTVLIALGIKLHPRYVGREYHKSSTPSCVVAVHIDTSPDHPAVQPFTVTAVGSRFADTYQIVARKALKLLCQLYEAPLTCSVMKYFPIADKNLPQWKLRLDYLTKIGYREYDPILVATTKYLHVLDDLCDQQAKHLESRIRHEEEAEARYLAVRLRLDEAEARAAKAESNMTAALAILTKLGNLSSTRSPHQTMKLTEHLLHCLANNPDPYQALCQVFYQDNGPTDMAEPSRYRP